MSCDVISIVASVVVLACGRRAVQLPMQPCTATTTRRRCGLRRIAAALLSLLRLHSALSLQRSHTHTRHHWTRPDQHTHGRAFTLPAASSLSALSLSLLLAMARLSSFLLVALCACSAVGLTSAVGPSPVSSAAAAMAHSTLDRVHEAIAHPLQAAPALTAAIAAVESAVESVAGGSLHAAQERVISPQARARAANFVHHIEGLITTLKHRAQLNRLSGKYDANATRSERIAVENSDEFEREAEMEADSVHVVPDHEHVRLEVVEPMPEPRASDFSDSPYMLHPVNIAPKSPSPSGQSTHRTPHEWSVVHAQHPCHPHRFCSLTVFSLPHAHIFLSFFLFDLHQV